MFVGDGLGWCNERVVVGVFVLMLVSMFFDSGVWCWRVFELVANS